MGDILAGKKPSLLNSVFEHWGFRFKITKVVT
jgi:hypothetical protein